MREYPLSLKASLKAGIRRDHRLGRNVPGLLECVNLKPIDGSLVYAEAPTQPFLTPPSVDWPYPQLIRGKGKTILAGKTALQFVDEATWGLTDIPVYNLSDLLNDLIANGAFTVDPDTGPTWRYGDQWTWAGGKMVRTPGPGGDPIGDGTELIDDDPDFDEVEGAGNQVHTDYWTPSSIAGRLHAGSSPAAKTCAYTSDLAFTLTHDAFTPTGGQKYVVQFELYACADLSGCVWSSAYGDSGQSIRVVLGGANSAWFNSNGVKLFAITAVNANAFQFAGVADVGHVPYRRLFIDSVSIQKWSYDSTVGADNLYQLFTKMSSVPVEGRRYKVTYTVTRSAGTVTMALGGTAGTARVAAGTYTDIVECGSGDRINFLASETFAGSIDLVKIMEDIQSGGGNGWHFMDFFDVWALFNTESTVFILKRSLLGGNDIAQVQSEVTINTGCAHRGRAILGGFNASDFWKTEWATFWDSWITSMGLSLPTVTGASGNFVFWSTIGGGDAFSILFPATAQEGLVGTPTTDGTLGDSIPGASGAQTEITDPYATGEEIHSASKPLIFDLIERGEWGLMPMPWQGDVLHVRPLGEGVMVYGEDGIAALFLASADGVPTYGLKELGIRSGIKSRDAVGGDEKTQAYVDVKSALWIVGEKLEPQRLGYQDVFKDLSNLIVSHDPDENEFYISNGYISYVLTKDGLGSISMPVSSLASIDGTLYAPSMKPADTALCSFMTDTFDMGVSGMKTIRIVKVGADLLYNMRVIVHYCYDPEEGEFEEMESTPFNNVGVAFPGASGYSFRIEVIGERKPGAYPSISDLDVGWCLVDKRYTRGVYAN